MNLGICVQCILNLAEMLQHSDFVCMSKALNRLDFGAPMLKVKRKDTHTYEISQGTIGCVVMLWIDPKLCLRKRLKPLDQ